MVDGLGLDDVGIAYDADGIETDRHLRTTLPHVYSIGDANGGMMFTHVATYEAPYAVANMLDGAELEPDYRTMPRAIFTDPVLAAVGLTEAEARAAGHDVEIRRSDVGTRGKARAIGDRRGRVKFVLDAGTGVILGVGILARDGADLLPGPQVAMNAPGGTLAPLLATVHTHPTIAEAVKVAARGWNITARAPGRGPRSGDPERVGEPSEVREDHDLRPGERRPGASWSPRRRGRRPRDRRQPRRGRPRRRRTPAGCTPSDAAATQESLGMRLPVLDGVAGHEHVRDGQADRLEPAPGEGTVPGRDDRPSVRVEAVQAARRRRER